MYTAVCNAIHIVSVIWYHTSMISKNEPILLPAQIKELLFVLKSRFEKNMHRHEGINWQNVEEKLHNYPKKLWSLSEMERTGGEPDVVVLSSNTTAFTFYDCCIETPKERRSVCYDRVALDSRKENKPKTSAMDMANNMGIEILTEEQYRALQNIVEFDTKTSSWIQTPDSIRALGGALFCDRRYQTVFTYHNGAESYYAARGFRGLLKV